MGVLDALLEGFDPHELRGAHGRWIHGVGAEGRAARGRGASSMATEHADTRDRLANLPQGQSYGLHGPRGQIGRVERTASGWQVIGPTDTHDRLHKTPSSAAGHAMKLQRTASANGGDVMMRNYRGREEVRQMNERQARRSEQEAERQLEVQARMSSSSRERAMAQTELDRRRAARTPRPRVRESAPEVLGVLLEGC